MGSETSDYLNVTLFYPFVFLRKTVSTDSTKPLIIPAGSDSFSQIGEHSAPLWTELELHLMFELVDTLHPFMYSTLITVIEF